MSLRGTLQSMPSVPGLYTALARALASTALTVVSFSAIPASERGSPALAPDIVHPLSRHAAKAWGKLGFEHLMYFKPLIFSQLCLQIQFKVIYVENLGTRIWFI